MRSRSFKPSNYPSWTFHTIRFFSLLCAVVVLLILIIFTVKLHDEKRKLPIAFLIQLIASVLTIINIFLTTFLYCCHGLSARFSLSLNIILFVVWVVGLGLFSWATAHTILTSCSTTYWGNSTGITVCRTYKAVFAFTIVAVLSHILSICVDIVARKRETHRGEYDRMPDAKLDDPDRNSFLISDGDLYHRLSPLPSSRNNEPAPTNVPSVPPSYSTIDLAERHHAGEAADYYDVAPSYGVRDRGRPHAGMGDEREDEMEMYYNGYGYGH